MVPSDDLQRSSENPRLSVKMSIDFNRIIDDAEDYVRRNVRPRSAREAQKRRAQRKLREFLRRVRRAGLILASLLVLLIAYSLLIGPIDLLTWIVALPTILLVAFLSLFWSRGSAPPEKPGSRDLPLEELALRVEDGLIDRAKLLPGHVLSEADAVIARLAELQPHLSEVEQDPLLAGDARRLLGQHLPRLVDTYLSLPPSQRRPHSESSRRFGEGLATVGEELDHLLDRCCSQRQLSFETQTRFIETRYREDRALRRQ